MLAVKICCVAATFLLLAAQQVTPMPLVDDDITDEDYEYERILQDLLFKRSYDDEDRKLHQVLKHLLKYYDQNEDNLNVAKRGLPVTVDFGDKHLARIRNHKKITYDMHNRR